MDDLQSDLKALEKLYSILQIRGDAQHGLAHAHETLDEKSRDVLKKPMDGATERAWIQFCANVPGPNAVTEKDEVVVPVGTSRNKMAADDYSTRSANKEFETLVGCGAPPPKPNHLHLNTHRTHPCPCLISNIRCKHHQHLLRRGLSTSTSCRSVKESAAATETHENDQKTTATIHIPPGRTMTLTPRMRPPKTTHEIPGQSRRKHMDSSVTSLAKDGSTKKMKEVKASKKPAGDDALSLKPKDEKKMKSSSSSQTSASLLPLHKTDSVCRRVQKSWELAGPTSQKKLHLLHDHHAGSRSRKKDGNKEGDSRTAASMHHKQQREERRRTQQMKKVGATLGSQRSTSHGGSRTSNSYMNYNHKKLPPRPRPRARARARGTVEFQSQTSSSYTITDSIDESASRTRNPSLSQRTSEKRKNSLIHHARRKSYSCSSSSSSCWLVSRPASSLRSRPRAVREKPTDNRRGRLRRFKDKLAVIFHHHHHYHLGSSGGDSEVEYPIPSEDNPQQRGSMRKPSGAGSAAAVIRAPRHRHRHHGHLYTLLQRLLRHVWHSRMEEEGKTGSRMVGMGRNDWCVQQEAAGGGGGVKLGSRKKKPAVGLGFSKAQRNKIQVP